MKPAIGVLAFTLAIVALAVWETTALARDAPNQITTDTGSDYSPAWSPDGSQIAFASDRSGNDDIWVIPAAGGIATQITTDAGTDGEPTWSPDGSQIAFASNRGGSWDIWVIPAAGGVATQITMNAGTDGQPDWSPDGTQIAFTSDRSGNEDIWVIPVTSGIAAQITNDVGSDQFPAWSPDGSQIAYLGGGFMISLIPATGGNATSLNQISFGPIAWSPDGGNIACTLPVPYGGLPIKTAIFVVPAVGGIPAQLTYPARSTDNAPAWSPDGSQIAFYSSRSGNLDIWVVSATGPVALEDESWGSIKGKYRE